MSRTRVVDLTFLIHEGMPVFPVHWHPKVEITPLGSHRAEHRETRKVVLGTHTGTHCDAPVHFIPGSTTIEKIPVDTFVGPAFVCDFSGARPGQRIEVADLDRQIEGRKVERLILRYDWSAHWATPRYYKDHPFLSVEAANWIVERGVRLLGMDTPMPDNPVEGAGTKNDSPIHKIVLGNGIILLEYLCNLKELRRKEVTLVALPLKIENGDGSPVRAVAIEEA